MTIKIRLPGGVLKVKQRHELRRREHKGEVPVWQFGKYFVIWWPSTIPDRPSKSSNTNEELEMNLPSTGEST
ncbi:hypothetical protein EOD10_19555 [Mesorhizobium sp. M7A.T.Ca.TU.009.01.3.2]|uniref:hypothetical protein n=1 Tax=unclassified Mesorhizobium TaxID=325217 RepID=UPI000FCB7153|nr:MULTISPECIES: hypothetical protein [unclassified Mesorhizobium]RUU10985.1 hypothetical protein EOD10_19555 [Mesorhizobium sp. M7A.T.Ca.TU.009.01.3.2]RUV11015.1 hypothetical protein EOD00_10890 [Mesorhizobium sp. M7A.T.Ca.TU.009.01.3.1]RUV51916.1 hypothetical protein EOB77_08915 [Mesorhizobium sp. M7A.F.Ca.MR.228.00.0.0]RUV22318.1 hypothetical protein EOB80_06740 [Mesorhizobium sp. M7A.F.Ca.MR.245.00.0.0]RVD51699.1 hypothetical protein EN750_30170 [Mesorhizobium sp. M7A.F.Ca.ET.027.03.2.1]